MKGDPSGIFNVEPLDPSGLAQLAASTERELLRVAAAFEIALVRQLEFLNVAPARPREGMVAGADGTNWNPGSGKGVYLYFNGIWNPVITAASGSGLYDLIGTAAAAVAAHEAAADPHTGYLTQAEGDEAYVQSDTATAVEVIERATYEALSPPDPTTIYFVLQ